MHRFQSTTIDTEQPNENIEWNKNKGHGLNKFPTFKVWYAVHTPTQCSSETSRNLESSLCGGLRYEN